MNILAITLGQRLLFSMVDWGHFLRFLSGALFIGLSTPELKQRGYISVTLYLWNMTLTHSLLSKKFLTDDDTPFCEMFVTE